MSLPDQAGGGTGSRRVRGLGGLALRNTALVMIARILSRLLALATVLLIARRLGDAGYGTFQAVVGATAIVVVVIDLGFNTLYLREGARRPGMLGVYLVNVATSKAVMSAAALGILALALLFLRIEPYLLPGFVVMVLTSYTNLLRNTFYALQRLAYEAIAILLESLVLLGMVIVGVLTHRGVAYFLWSYSVSYAASTALFLIAIWRLRLLRFAGGLDARLVRSWLWSGLPFALTFVITVVYFNVDQLMLFRMRPGPEPGWYGIAYKPFQALLFVPQTMLGVAFPVLAVYHREAPERLRPALEVFYKALFTLGWPLTIGTVMLAPGITRLLLPFPQAEPALAILGGAVVVMFCTNAFIAGLNSIDRQLSFTYAALASMVVNVSLNLAFIPRYGYLGAAWVTVVTEVFLLAAAWVLLGRSLAWLPLHRLSWKPLLAGLVMAAVIYPLRSLSGLQVLVPALLGLAVYAGACYLLRVAGPTEIALARAALRRPE